jgi:hypothetical protein
MNQETPWLTIKDAHDGIETFLLDGPRTLVEICRMAREHGSTDFDTAGFVRALEGACRLEATPGFKLNNPSYQLTESTRAALEAR